MQTLQSLRATMQREFALNIAQQGEWLNVILYYVLITILFPIVMGPTPTELAWLSPVIIWIAALLSTLVAQDNLLRSDYANGLLEQMLLSKQPFAILITAKVVANWIVFALPMIILTPLIAAALNIDTHTITLLTLSLAIGTITLHFIGAFGAALTVSLARGGVFLAILILPLYTPVLVLGASAAVLSLGGVVSYAHLALLSALAIASVLFIPAAISAAIKANI